MIFWWGDRQRDRHTHWPWLGQAYWLGRRRKFFIRCELLIYGWSFKWLMRGQTDRHTDKQKHAFFKLQVNSVFNKGWLHVNFWFFCEGIDRPTDTHINSMTKKKRKKYFVWTFDLRVNFWMTDEGTLSPWGQTDRHKHRQTETCINTITRPGLAKWKGESKDAFFFIIYIVYHLEWFTLFQRNKKVEAQPRPFYFSEKE